MRRQDADEWFEDVKSALSRTGVASLESNEAMKAAVEDELSPFLSDSEISQLATQLRSKLQDQSSSTPDAMNPSTTTTSTAKVSIARLHSVFGKELKKRTGPIAVSSDALACDHDFWGERE